MNYREDIIIDLFDSISEVTDEGKPYWQLDKLDRDELVQTFVEIDTIDTDNFLKIKETLQRIGIANRDKKTLYQSCMLLHKKGRFYICHFKELFAMDAKYTEIYQDDYLRRNHIAKLLESWNLVKIKNKHVIDKHCGETPINVYVLPHKERKMWDLQAKYTIGTVPKRKEVK